MAQAFADPRVRVVCPRGCRKKVEEVVKVDATFDEIGQDDRVPGEDRPALLADLRGKPAGVGGIRGKRRGGEDLQVGDVGDHGPQERHQHDRHARQAPRHRHAASGRNTTSRRARKPRSPAR